MNIHNKSTFSLSDWLAWQASLHPKDIALGLERVKEVAARLFPFELPMMIITVAGTNGKGSTVAFLESILLANDYQVGSYTSPHLQCYNERVRVNGNIVNDEMLCQAFLAIEEARGDILLTYFEFSTLAAVYIFMQQHVQIAILEVGLGGRLDAVNCFSAAYSLITNIALDHQDWLGDNREAIGLEKAGIMRDKRPTVYAEEQIPNSILHYAQQCHVPLYRWKKDYNIMISNESWEWQYLHSNGQRYSHLPFPQLKGAFQIRNAAAAIMLLEITELTISAEAIKHGIKTATLMGRYQKIAEQPDVILDVAHNPHAAKYLVELLQQEHKYNYVILGMLQDKDIHGVINELNKITNQYACINLPSKRSIDAKKLASIIQQINSHKSVTVYNALLDAYTQIKEKATIKDRIIIIGSFFTVAEALSYIR